MNFSDLTDEQRCVFDNASDEGDLSGVLLFWGCDPSDPDFAEIRERFVATVLELVRRDLVEVSVYTDARTTRALSIDEAERLVPDPAAWPTADDGPEMMLWTVLTDQGSGLRATAATVDELYSYRNRP